MGIGGAGGGGAMSKVEFKGSIAATQSALTFGSKIGRVTFEVPESEISAAIGLVALQETPLKITVEVDNEYSEKGDGKNASASNKTARRWPSDETDAGD